MEDCRGPYGATGFLPQPNPSGSNTCYSEPSSHLFRGYINREINAFLWISLISVTFLLLRKLGKLFELWYKGGSIPGPSSPSFYGDSKLISQLKSSETFTDLLSRLHERYGPVIKLWLGPTQLLVSIKDVKLIKQMLVKAKDKLPLTERAFCLAFGRLSLFVSSFEKVQTERDFLAVELNSQLLQSSNMISKQVIDRVMERIHNIAVSGALDCQMVSQQMAFTILGATFFGDTFLTWPKATACEETFIMIAKEAYLWASHSITPFWKTAFWRYRALCKKLKCLTQDIIQQCMQKDSSHHIAREEPCANIMGLMFHGCQTTAVLIGDIIARLVTHPELQDKIYSEITLVRNGLQQQQDKQDVQDMLFLLATVYESARLLSAGQLLQRCSLKNEVNLKAGLTLPAGAILVVPLQLVQKDEFNWGGDATQFNPDRFLSVAEKGSDLVQMTSFKGFAEELVYPACNSYVLNDPTENAAFLPFGSGVRACVGQKFVILKVATLIASLLEQYEIRLQPGPLNDSKSMNNGVFQLLPSPNIVFSRRKS